MPGNMEDNTVFIGDFDDQLERDIVIPLTKEIHSQSKLKDGHINMYINSFGGYGHLVMHLVELMETAKRQGVLIRTVVTNTAFSAGSILAVAGSPGERYISKAGEHLIHYGSIASFETTPVQIDRYNKYKKRWFQTIVRHYEKYCNIPNLAEYIQDDGYFLSAAECLKYKVADKYMDKLKI